MLDKILIIILILLIFYYIININIETFATKQYTNTNEYSWERNNIKSSLPYDIILQNNNNLYYDYGNDELDEKFNKIFNINNEKIIKTIEGMEWSKWILASTSKNKKILDNYFNKFLIYFNTIITSEYFDLPGNDNDNDNNNDNDNDKYNIKEYILRRYKLCNIEDTLLLDIELLIYRKNKPLARHIKILVITNGIYNNVIMAKVIGVINECNLMKKYETLDGKNNYQKFEPEFTYKYDMNSFIYDTNEKLVHSAIEYNLYNKLLKEL
jgi:hypothetical protein